MHAGRPIEAVGYLQRSLHLDRKLLANASRNAGDAEELRRRIGALLHNLGAAYYAAGAYEQAVSSCEEALAWDAGAGAVPAAATTARRYNNIAAAYDRLGEHAKAIEYIKKRSPSWKATIRRRTPSTVWPWACVTTISDWPWPTPAIRPEHESVTNRLWQSLRNNSAKITSIRRSRVETLDVSANRTHRRAGRPETPARRTLRNTVNEIPISA